MSITNGTLSKILIRNYIACCDAERHLNKQMAVIDYSNFGDYLNNAFGNSDNRKYAVMIVVNQACYSGTMMSHLSGENRILISAADSMHEAYTEWGYPKYQHFAFFHEGGMPGQYPGKEGFTPALGTLSNPKNLHIAFDDGSTAEYYNGEHAGEKYSFPQLDSQDISQDNVYL